MPIATSDALLGLGMPAQLGAIMGANPLALTTTGTTSGGAAVIRSRNTELVTGASATGGIIPATAGVMEPYFITFSASASTSPAIIYLPTGHVFNTSGAPTFVNLAQYKSIIMWQYKPKFWCYVILA